MVAGMWEWLERFLEKGGIFIVLGAILVCISLTGLMASTSTHYLDKKRIFIFKTEEYKVRVTLRYNGKAVNFNHEEIPLEIARLFRRAEVKK